MVRMAAGASLKQGLPDLIPKQRSDGVAIFKRGNFAASLLLPLLLLGCSAISSSAEDAPASGPDASYNTMVANLIKDSFKEYASYQDFEISAYRWVHSLRGWTWLTCVRYRDKDRQLTYAVYIKAQKITASRYAIQSDACEQQTYTPFTLLGGARSPASGSGLEPLH